MKTYNIALCALFAALSATLSQVSIPIGTVPVNITHISVFMAAGLLGAKRGAVSQAVYVMMGAVGLPVFSGLKGGAGVIFGPTGGFIIGYILCAYVTGLIIEGIGRSIKTLMLAMYAGWVITYILGVLVFMVVTGLDLNTALLTCVFPFLLIDIPKTLISAVLVNRMARFVRVDADTAIKQ